MITAAVQGTRELSLHFPYLPPSARGTKTGRKGLAETLSMLKETHDVNGTFSLGK